MQRYLAVIGAALLLSGCVETARIAYFEPEGEGRVKVDGRGVPQMLEMRLNQDSTLVVSAWREAGATRVTFWLHLRTVEDFQFACEEVGYRCGDLPQGQVRLSSWEEWRIANRVGYHVYHPPTALLKARDFDSDHQKPPRVGDVSTGQYWSHLKLEHCADQDFSLVLPRALLDGHQRDLGQIMFHRKEGRFTWMPPLQ